MSTIRNERPRLPYFLEYYKTLGAAHFLFVDNGSTDGSREYLEADARCSVWHTNASYRRSDHGIDWMNWLLRKHAVGHWALVVDADEFFVYPYVDTRPLQALVEWLDASRRRSFGAMLMDMYSRHAIEENVYAEGEDPFRILRYFDSGNYYYIRNGLYRNLWIRGGPRLRVFFADRPNAAPALNKIPLVKWDRHAVFKSSTHTLLPRSLNKVYDVHGGEHTTGALLHAKFISSFAEKAREEVSRKEHYANGKEYRVYNNLSGQIDLWTPHSTEYRDWRQLHDLGLISIGAWA